MYRTAVYKVVFTCTGRVHMCTVRIHSHVHSLYTTRLCIRPCTCRRPCTRPCLRVILYYFWYFHVDRACTRPCTRIHGPYTKYIEFATFSQTVVIVNKAKLVTGSLLNTGKTGSGIDSLFTDGPPITYKMFCVYSYHSLIKFLILQILRNFTAIFGIVAENLQNFDNVVL